MGKTKSIDTHNGGWKHEVGRKGTGAPGQKRKQTSRKLGKFKDFTDDDGRRFEQKVPAKQKRMMMMMKEMQEKRVQKEAGVKKVKHNGRAAMLDTGADSVHPEKAKRQQQQKKKEKNEDTTTAQWLTTENGGRGGLDGPNGVEAPQAAPSTGRKPLEMLPDESMKDYSRRLKAYTRKNMLTDIRDSRKKAVKQKAWLQDRKISKKEKKKAKLAASAKRAAKRTAGRSGDTSSDDEEDQAMIRKRNNIDDEYEDEPSSFGTGKGWAGAEQAERPPQFGTGEGKARTEAKGLGKARVSSFQSTALHRMRAIEQYRKQKGTGAGGAKSLILPSGGMYKKAEEGGQEHTFVNKKYDD
jgi:hypothetical protein